MKIGILKWLFTSVCVSALSMVVFAKEVELLKAESRVASVYGTKWQGGGVQILVENLGFAKYVALHIEAMDGSWIDIPAYYQRTVGDGRELWYVAIHRYESDPLFEQDLHFALKYEVEGQVFWDDNAGNNYFVEANSGELITPAVLADGTTFTQPITYDYPNGQSYTYPGTFSVIALVKNVDYVKDVTVHYTYDGWKTKKSGKAFFMGSRYQSGAYIRYPNVNGVEGWRFTAPSNEIPAQSSEVEYAVSYRVNGTTYWDNNYGDNYRQTR